MENLPLSSHPDLLLGVESASDAGIFKLTDDIAIVQSVDFFTPIVDDPYEFGQIAAANSLSDIYAVGAKPITALNIVCFPIKDQPKSVLEKILRGGVDKIHEAGALLIGGHSVEAKEPKYGLSVTGIVHPERFICNKGARPNDNLVLTKPIGMGILSTALKAGLLDKKDLAELIILMKTLNKDASEAMMELGAHGATDVTGFGLAGHALEMAMASHVKLVIDSKKVPILKNALHFSNMGFIPEGDYANKDFCKKAFKIDKGVDQNILTILFDAQTSGGLLISIPEEKAQNLVSILKEKGHKDVAIIGFVEEGDGVVEII